MIVSTHQTNFAAGEISEVMLGRMDMKQYANGLKTCYNMVVRPQGGSFNRTGFQHLTLGKDQSHPTWSIAFEPKLGSSYVIEFGHNYLRVQKDGVFVTLTNPSIGGDESYNWTRSSSRAGSTSKSPASSNIGSQRIGTPGN